MLASLLLPVLAACTTEQPLPPNQAQTLIADAWQADQHIVWELDWPAAPIGGPLTVETWRAGQRYRFEILESVAPALVGETLVHDGQTAWQYNRFGPESPVRLDSPRLSPVTDAFTIVDGLITRPPQTATLEQTQTSHGPAQKISLTFANGDRLILWRDEDTHLPVRVVFEVRRTKATLEARHFERLVDPPQALFTLD
jgi:hypothetical protein